MSVLINKPLEKFHLLVTS